MDLFAVKLNDLGAEGHSFAGKTCREVSSLDGKRVGFLLTLRGRLSGSCVPSVALGFWRFGAG